MLPGILVAKEQDPYVLKNALQEILFETILVVVREMVMVYSGKEGLSRVFCI